MKRVVVAIGLALAAGGCGDDAPLQEELSQHGERILNDALDGLCQDLAYADVATIAGKNELRERMIIAFSAAFHTNSIRDIYFQSFIIY